MLDEQFPTSRFLVRQGSDGWMVYDRKRKGPAMIGSYLKPVINLTKEEAERIQRSLAGAALPAVGMQGA
jgi:hypothetical protein